MSDFLFELLLEELPHSEIDSVFENGQAALEKYFFDYKLSFSKIDFFCTPRRLSFFVENLSKTTAPQISEYKGPSRTIAYDVNNQASVALEKFLASHGATEQNIFEKDIKGQPYIFLRKEIEGLDLQEVLSDLIQQWILNFKFSHMMSWNYKDSLHSFIRPVRALLAILDEEIIPLKYFSLESGRSLKGHRQLFPESVELISACDYVTKLRSLCCTPSFCERADVIREKSSELASQVKGKLVLDEDLLKTLTALTECPNPLLAEFSDAFLDLPQELLISEMKIHQKYIPIVNAQNKLLPYYIIVSNIPIDNELAKSNVLRGNAKVLNARFSDGRFFFEEDTKKGLDYYQALLKSVAFFEGAGSIYDKTERMQVLAKYFQQKFAISYPEQEMEQAIRYCKADLNSLMVVEFPDLQGIMGGYYAEKMSLPENVVLAIKEQYYPRYIDGSYVYPKNEFSAFLGFIDRFDTLCTLYALGKTVTGSKDPYALRRYVVAIIHLIHHFQWRSFSLKQVFSDIASHYTHLFQGLDASKWIDLLSEFIAVRLKNILKSTPYYYSLESINAIFARGLDHIIDDIDNIGCLENIRATHALDIEKLIILSKRIQNILKDETVNSLEEKLLIEDTEQKLFQVYQNLSDNLDSNQSFEDQLLGLLTLEPYISSFFEKIMVKTGDHLEKNRIALLSKIHTLFMKYLDFTKLSF